MKNDPLAYKVHDADGITIAMFDDWETNSQSHQQGFMLSSNPRGRESEFILLTIVVAGNPQQMSEFLSAGPLELEAMIPTLRRSGEPKPVKFGGDEARLIDFEGTGVADLAGKAVRARAAIVRKKDIALAVLGVGTMAAFEEFGRAIEIVAQSVSFRESPLDPALVGTWLSAGTTSSGMGPGLVSVSWRTTLAIYPNGSFIEWDATSAGSSAGDLMSDGGHRGSIIRRGNSLTLHYDNGKVKNVSFEFSGATLLLNGVTWRRQ